MNVVCVLGAKWGSHAATRAMIQTHGVNWEFTCEEDMLPAVMHAAQPRYVFFLNWSHLVKPDVLALSECVNFHCTPLPYGRGGGPIENMILEGHTHTVITAHRMVEALDAGDIYTTRGPISLVGTKDDIRQRFITPVADMMQWIIETNPTPTPQVGEPTYFKRLSPEAYAQFWKDRA